MRKSNNVFKPWKPVVAVLTVDGYLHIFDIPQVRMHTLIPHLCSSCTRCLSTAMPTVKVTPHPG
jgi:hypothetical protein